MSDYIKICPKCNTENEANMDFCIACGNLIKLVIPIARKEKNEDSKKIVESLAIRYYKQCRVCGSKNYLKNKLDFLDSCSSCGNEDINDVPTFLEEPQKIIQIKYALKDNNGHLVEIKKDSIIGRYGDVDCDYFSQNPYISGNHAKIFLEDDIWYIKDLNSTNGTYLNGLKLQSEIKYKLENNYQLKIANLDLTWIKYED